MRPIFHLSILALTVCGCSPTAVEERKVVEPTPPQAQAPAKSAPEPGAPKAAPSPSPIIPAAVEKTMPQAMRGQWRVNDLRRAPTAEDCNQTSQTNQNFGKVLNITANGYSVFEEGGRPIEVHARSENRIDATFDTTYADTPTRARRNFALQSGGALAVNDEGDDGRSKVTQYRRCPRSGA